jgi:hypothetical protein
MVIRVLSGLNPSVPVPIDAPKIGDLGYDPEFDAVQRRLAAALAAQQSHVNEDTNNVNLDVGTRRHNVEQQHPLDIKNILENFAGRGMAYSGRYAQDNQANEDQYAGQLSGLDSEKATRLSAIQRAMQQFQDDQQTTMNDAYSAYAGRAAAKAEADAAAAQAAAGSGPVTIPGDVVPTTPDTGLPTAGIVLRDPTTGQGNETSVAPSTDVSTLMAATPAPVISAPNAPGGTSYVGTAPVTNTSTPTPFSDPGTRTMASFSAHDQNILHGGGTVVGGNGYTYRSVNGVPVRMA